MTYTTPKSKHVNLDYGVVSISLPSLPFDLPKAKTDETKPTAPPVRCELTHHDKRWLRGVLRVKI